MFMHASTTSQILDPHGKFQPPQVKTVAAEEEKTFCGPADSPIELNMNFIHRTAS